MSPILLEQPLSLHELPAKYDFLFRLQPLPMWVFDTKTLRFLMVNDAAVEAYGYPRECFMRMSLLDVRDRHDPRNAGLFARVNEPGARRISARHRRADGSLIDVEVFTQAFEFEGCNARLATVLDISDQRNAERERSRSLNLLRAITDGVPDAIYVKDAEGRFLFANAGVAQAAGIAADSIVGRLDSEVFDADTTREFRRNEGKVLRGQTISEREVTIAEDRRRVYSTIKVPYRDDAGDVIGVIGVSRDVTAQSQIEDALRDIEERFRQAHEYAAFGSAICALDGSWLHVNASLCDILGYSESELLARTFHDITYAEDSASDLEMARDLIEDRVQFLRRDKRYIHKDGRLVWCELTASIVRDPIGQPLYFVAQIQDIGERRAAQEALRESESQLRFLFENMTDGVIYRDRNGSITHANPAAELLLGLSRQVVDGVLHYIPSLRVLSDDGSEMRIEDLPTSVALRTGRIIRDVVVGIDDREHGRRWLLESAVPQFRPGETEPYRVFGTFKDITSLREAEHDLRNSQEKLQIVLQQAPAVVWTTDRNLVISWTDGAGFAKLDTTPAAAIGRSILSWFAEESDAVRAHRAALQGESARYELELADRLFEVYAKPLRDSDNSIDGVICLALDTTDARAAERTLQHQEDQLRQAQKMEAIGRLAGGVAHDFNNILTAITGNAEFALDALDKRDPVVEDITEIRRGAERAAALTRQLLAFSRRQVLQSVVLDINTVASDLRSLLQRLIGEDVELVCTAGSEPCCVFTDRGQLEQVVMNLAVNARDAMPDGGRLVIDTGELVLTAALNATSAIVPPGAYARISVQDSGCGISAENLTHIFEPFFTTKGIGRGTGLGLSTVYGIVQQSGGYISVETSEGAGTRFDILLPRVYELPEEILRAPASAGASAGETILLVEDELAVRHMAERSLLRKGYTVLCASSSADALLIASAYPQQIDLMVTDVIMPNGSGAQLAEAVQQARKDLKVLFISGYTDDAIEQHGVLAPGMWFLPKPFTPDVLAAKVRMILDQG